MRHLVCLIRAYAGTPGGFLEAGANDLQSLEDLFPWQPAMLLSIRELISIPSLVYLSLIRVFFSPGMWTGSVPTSIEIHFQNKGGSVYVCSLSFPLFICYANQLFILLGPL